MDAWNVFHLNGRKVFKKMVASEIALMGQKMISFDTAMTM
jgi:hypothetical protein